jgi:hypothetical protein
MNWKILLVIAGLSLSAGLTACNKEAAAPDATKTETTTTSPGATDPTKPAAPGQTKTTETKTTKPDATKKP